MKGIKSGVSFFPFSGVAFWAKVNAPWHRGSNNNSELNSTGLDGKPSQRVQVIHAIAVAIDQRNDNAKQLLAASQVPVRAGERLGALASPDCVDVRVAPAVEIPTSQASHCGTNSPGGKTKLRTLVQGSAKQGAGLNAQMRNIF